nr:hypothetical protein [Candidatus Cloacimonadota bacterium]
MKKWITLILGIACSFGLGAISLQESIELARENNKNLLMAADDVQMADAKYREVRGTLLPQLSLGGQYGLTKTYLPDSASGEMPSVSDMLDDEPSADDADYLIGDTLDGIMARLMPSSSQKEGSLAAQVKMDQVLFLGGKLMNGIKAAKRYRSIQRLNYEVTEQDVILKTINLFYQTILAGKVVEVQREALETAQRHLARVELLGEEGQVSEFDLIGARLEVAKLQPQLLAAENQYEMALESFRNLIGSADPDLVPEAEFILPQVTLMDLQEAQELGLKNRTELELLDIATEVKEIQYKTEKGNFLPSIALNASASLYTAADEYAIEADDFGTSYAVGIGFSMPLFTGLSNTSKIAYARHDLSKAHLQQIQTEELVELEIKQNHQRLRHALENYDVQIQNIQMAERNLELAQLRYENNVGIQLEVFDAQMTLSSIKLQYYSAIYEVIAAERAFSKSIGQNLIAER